MRVRQVELTERQTLTDEGGHGEYLQSYFRQLFEAYGVTYVSVVVVGQRYPPPPDGKDSWVEIVYAVSVDSKLAIPHALEGKSRIGLTGNRFSYAQLANSVYTHSYSTAFTAMYTGSDPPTEPPPG